MTTPRPSTPTGTAPNPNTDDDGASGWQTVARPRRTSQHSTTAPSASGSRPQARVLKVSHHLSSPGRRAPGVVGARVLASLKPPPRQLLSTLSEARSEKWKAPGGGAKSAASTSSGSVSYANVLVAPAEGGGKKAAITEEAALKVAAAVAAKSSVAATAPAEDSLLFDGTHHSDIDFDSSDEENGEDPAPESFDSPVLVICPFPHPDPRVPDPRVSDTTASQMQASTDDAAAACAFTKPRPLTDHLLHRHAIKFRNLHHMYFSLQSYLDHWAKITTAPTTMAAVPGIQIAPQTNLITIDPEVCAHDMDLRRHLQRQKLDEILTSQDHERHTDAQRPRRCLFCATTPDTRALLFRHMFIEHGFNIGLPDNLVHVEDFLNVLQTKLNSRQCLYCERTYSNATVLRRHMRKKKHFKISAMNRRYDRYYVINYLEPGKNWEDFEAEARRGGKDEDEDDDGDATATNATAFEEWDEADVETTLCLFCPATSDSPEASLEHMIAKHAFDLFAVKEQLRLGFYKAISLVNFIRHHAEARTCYACVAAATVSKDAGPTKVFDTPAELLAHMTTNGCITNVPGGSHPLYSDSQYLFPAIENDPLLMVVELEDGEAEEGEDEKREAVESVMRRLSMVETTKTE